jgi:hypothetical protein
MKIQCKTDKITITVLMPIRGENTTLFKQWSFEVYEEAQSASKNTMKSTDK